MSQECGGIVTVEGSVSLYPLVLSETEMMEVENYGEFTGQQNLKLYTFIYFL